MENKAASFTPFQNDIDTIGQIPIVANLLEVICRTTGMGFAAIARVTEDAWVTCSVRDTINFGLKPGDELEIGTIICNEVRHDNKAVVINHVALDPQFCNHHTPALYGFESYISVPITRKDGSFFGTLCAIDPQPKQLSSAAVTGMFFLFADLISFHLHAIEQVKASELKLAEEQLSHQKTDAQHKRFTHELETKVQERTRQLHEKNEMLEKMNSELQSFTYIASHDLQEPLRKIRLFTDYINKNEVQRLSARGKDDFARIQQAAGRMQTLINDLISYPQTIKAERNFETATLTAIVEEVTAGLKEELSQKHATVEVKAPDTVKVIVFQFRQLFYNLISNALKFSAPERLPHIVITSEIKAGKPFEKSPFPDGALYCHIGVSDNGTGFDPEYSEKIFELFKRLHSKHQYEGTGIGLAIVKKIVENHQGIITAKSKVNEGTRFDIYIPAL